MDNIKEKIKSALFIWDKPKAKKVSVLLLILVISTIIICLSGWKLYEQNMNGTFTIGAIIFGVLGCCFCLCACAVLSGPASKLIVVEV